MTTATHEERSVSLRKTSWKLLDEAAALWDGTPDEILDSLLQGFLATDDGRTVARAEALSAIRRHFGENQG